MWLGGSLSIKKIVVDDGAGIFDDLRRGDHVVFGLNTFGSHPEGAGYGVVEYICSNYCHEFKDIGKNDLGTIISHESEGGVWFHGIVDLKLPEGWVHDEYGESSYLAIQQALNMLYDKWDDELTRPMRSLWLGRGKQRKVGDAHGNINWTLQAMANSKLELVVYITDGWYHESLDDI